MSDKRSISRRQFFALSACGALLGGSGLAACGGSVSKDRSQRVTTSTSRAVTFALDYTPNTNHTGIYIAQTKRYFADEGLEVTVVQPPADGADSLVRSKQAQFGMGYQEAMAHYLGSARPLPISAVAAVIQHNALFHALAGFAKPSSGRAYVAGTEVTGFRDT